MLRINEELGFLSGTTADIRHNSDDESPIYIRTKVQAEELSGRSQKACVFKIKLVFYQKWDSAKELNGDKWEMAVYTNV